MSDDQKREANRRISAAVVALKRMPTQTTGHMDEDERGAAVGQMLADLYTLAANDGCVAAGWAYEFACEVAEKSARVTAERDAFKAACETMLACDRETSPPAERELLARAVEQARAALKLCEVQQ